MNRLTSEARGAIGKALLAFAESNNLTDDWYNINHRSRVNAFTSGSRLDNTIGSSVFDAEPDSIINPEILVHLSGSEEKLTINLALVLAMATEYCKSQRELAKHQINEELDEYYNGPQKPKASQTKVRASRRKS